MVTFKTYRRIQFVVAVWLAAFGPNLFAAEVSVSVQPRSFPVDRGGQLSVVATNGDFDRIPNPPVPDGVSIRQYGQNHSIQFINGRRSQSTTQNFVVSANKPGTYTIPSFEVRISGQRLKTRPVTFNVIASNAPQINQSQSSNQATGSTEPLGFLRLDFPARGREHLYVGEMAPVRIKAYFPANTRVSLRSSPRPEGKGFTLHNLSEEPDQSNEVVNGKRYRTVTWFAGISIAKAGEFPITVGLDATVMVPDTSQKGRRRRGSLFDSFFGGNSPFNDPFFDDVFDSAFTRSIPREITLNSPGDPLNIKSLPSEGRPENFSGAVGEFAMGGYRLPADANTGEPQKIRVTINGKGNFDRLSAPTIEPADAWKTYQPKIEFNAGDVVSFSGSKTFDFNAVPQKAGEQKIALSFSFFNPTTEKYQTVKSEQIPLLVSGENVKSTAELKAAVQPKSKKQQKAESAVEPQTGLAPLRPVAGGYTSLAPLLKSSGYWVVVGIGLIGIASSFVVGSIRKRKLDPKRVATLKAQKGEQAALARAEQAASDKDVVVFFTAARQAIQEKYGLLWNQPSEAITIAELLQNLPEDSPAIKLFAEADALAYAPEGAVGNVKLREWKKKLNRALASTE